MSDNKALIARAEAFLVECGYHDAGLLQACTCPPGDPRSVILELVNTLATEAPRLDAELDEVRLALVTTEGNWDRDVRSCGIEIKRLEAENEGLRADLREAEADIARWRKDYERKNTIAARGVWDSAHKADAISLLREQQRTCAELIPGEVVLIEVSRVLNALGETVQP